MHPGDRCVVIGAGGLGHIGIQVLKAMSPAEIIVVDRNPDAVKLAVSRSGPTTESWPTVPRSSRCWS